jgi:Mg2+ and Co2+ transporter CorA
MNQAIAQLLQSIKGKLSVLQRSHHAVLQKNETLQKRITALENKNTELEAALQNTSNQLAALKTMQSNLPTDERKVLAKILENHIKQIDNTINILSDK